MALAVCPPKIGLTAAECAWRSIGVDEWACAYCRRPYVVE